jgi:hypothetical protein
MLFSDKHRVKKIFLSILVLLGFCLYAQIESKRAKDNLKTKYLNCINKSDLCQNQTLTYFGIVSEVTSTSFILHPRTATKFGGGDQFESENPIHLKETTHHTLKNGDKINLLVRYDEQSIPHLVKFYQIKGERRFIKYLVSCLGLGLWMLLFWQRYRISWQTKTLFTPRKEG